MPGLAALFQLPGMGAAAPAAVPIPVVPVPVPLTPEAELTRTTRRMKDARGKREKWAEKVEAATEANAVTAAALAEAKVRLAEAEGKLVDADKEYDVALQAITLARGVAPRAEGKGKGSSRAAQDPAEEGPASVPLIPAAARKRHVPSGEGEDDAEVDFEEPSGRDIAVMEQREAEARVAASVAAAGASAGGSSSSGPAPKAAAQRAEPYGGTAVPKKKRLDAETQAAGEAAVASSRVDESDATGDDL
jgi:transformation/transcription domain-associated protein